MQPLVRGLAIRRLARLLVLSAIIVAIAACGSATPTPPALPQVDPREMLREAVTRLLQLESVAFTLEHENGSTTLFPGLEMTKASGVVDIPDRFKLTVEAESAFPRSFIKIDVVTIEDTAYMTDIISGNWRQIGVDVLPFRFVDLGKTLADIIEAVREPELTGSANLRGIDTHRVKGSILSQDLAALVPGSGDNFDVELELWLEQESNLLRQVKISGMVVPTDIPGAIRLLTLDDLDVPVEILPPI